MINGHFIREVGLGKWICRLAVRQFYKRILKKDHWLSLPTGGRIFLPLESRFASEVYVTNAQVDWGSEAVLYHFLQGGDFLDIGANIGYYSAYMAPKCGAVVAFEPDARALRHLRITAAKIANIVIVQSAVSDFVGESLFVEEGGSELSHLDEGQGKGTKVAVTTIDAFLKSASYKVQGIKVDAEGADLKIIQGGAETLQIHRPVVLTEAPASDALFGLLSPLGYVVFAFMRTSGGHFLFREIELGAWRGLTTKMLFLVPAECRERILACVRG